MDTLLDGLVEEKKKEDANKQNGGFRRSFVYSDNSLLRMCTMPDTLQCVECVALGKKITYQTL